jgi:hypothetical protein
MDSNKKPNENNKVQSWVAKIKFKYLLVLYLLGTLLIAVFFGLLWFLLSPDQTAFSDLGHLIWKSFTFLYGYQPETNWPITWADRWMTGSLSLIGFLGPSLLLGTIVFKLFIPTKGRVIFRDQVSHYEDANKVSHLAVHCYLSSRINFVDWKFRAFIRIEIESKSTRFPLRSYEVMVRDEYIPDPFEICPTRILIPYELIDETNTEQVDGVSNSEKICSLYKQQSEINPNSIPVFKKDEHGENRLARVYSVVVEPEDRVDWQLIILTSAYMPQLGMGMVETKKYHSSMIRFDETLEIRTDFDQKANKVRSVEWNKF